VTLFIRLNYMNVDAKHTILTAVVNDKADLSLKPRQYVNKKALQ